MNIKERWKGWYEKNKGLTIVGTLILIMALAAIIFPRTSEAADYTIGLDMTKPVNCTNATQREDGTPLAASAIDFVTITVRTPPPNNSFSHDIQMLGGCTPTTFDLTLLPGAGAYEQVGTTTDKGGRVSALSPVPFPFNYVASQAAPKPPVITE